MNRTFGIATALLSATFLVASLPAMADDAATATSPAPASSIICVGSGMDISTLQCFDSVTHAPVAPPTGRPSTAPATPSQ